MCVIYDIFDIVSKNQGKREINITIKSKLGDLQLDSSFYINNNAEPLLKQLEGVHVA